MPRFGTATSNDKSKDSPMNSLRLPLLLLLVGSARASFAAPKSLARPASEQMPHRRDGACSVRARLLSDGRSKPRPYIKTGVGGQPPIESRLAPFRFSEDDLEARWSYRARLEAPGKGEAAWLFGENEKNAVIVSVFRENGKLMGQLRRVGGAAPAPIRFQLAGNDAGEIGFIRVGRLFQVLWNGHVRAQMQTDLGGVRFGMRVSDGWKRQNAGWQPTEPVVFRDDFMRADGPDSPAMASVWSAGSDWKTSGTLGPKADAALSPNPFVFRATGAGVHVARAGKWFWNDYAVSASVRAVSPEGDESSPLVAGLEAFSSGNSGVRGEINFRTGVARILIDGKPVAQSAPFDAAIGEWHRLRLEPNNGVARLLFDGREVARAKCDLAGGEIALRAQTGANGFVDFDDVRAQNGPEQLGEGQLPDRLVKDRLMRNWANAASAWKRDARGVWWHTGDFWGATNLDLPLPKLEDGQGYRVYLGADSQNLTGATPVLIERKEGKLRATMGGKGKTLSDAAQNAMRLRRTPNANGTFALTLDWNGVSALSLFTGRGTGGTKIGVQPLRAGASIPPPPLRKLELKATTFERDGHSAIGVNITPVSPAIARDMGLPDATGAVIDNVEDGSPAQVAGFKNGDVVRSANGARVTDVDTMRAAVGAVHAPGSLMLEILRAPGDGSGLDWAACRATTPNQLDYAFTSAPVDWQPARGQWEVAERWTCSPQWSFFAGGDDEFPLLWSRFALKGDWTLEAYMATPMDLTRGERSPTDLNISVGDGRTVSSGYSFAFGARNRSNNLIWRGNSVVQTKPFEMPPSAGETHQDWFYIRLERRHTAHGVRFRWSANGQPLGEYEDTNPINAANRLAFWTKNGALSLARVRLWHDGLAPLSPDPRPSSPGLSALSGFTARGTGRDVSAHLSLAKDGALEVRNPRDGGDWTLYAAKPGAALGPDKRGFSFSYRATPDVKLNLYAKVAGSWREIAWTGGAAKSDDNQPTLGTIEGVQTDNEWHTARLRFGRGASKERVTGQPGRGARLRRPRAGLLAPRLGR